MKPILTIFFAVASILSYAQPLSPGETSRSKILADANAKISGTVVDAESNAPVEFATIALHDATTDKVVNGSVADAKGGQMQKAYVENEEINLAADPVVQYMTKPQLEKSIRDKESQMQRAAKELDFMEAARLRDEMLSLKKLMEDKYENG